MFKLEAVNPDIQPLEYQHNTDSGLDVTAEQEQELVGLFDVMLNMCNLVLARVDPNITPLTIDEVYEPFWTTVPTGYKVSDMEPGTEIQVRPRSGLAAKNGISVLNTPGTCDSGYRGLVKVIMVNFGKNYLVRQNERIAQLVHADVIQEESYFTSNKESRGENGFGSTGTV